MKLYSEHLPAAQPPPAPAAAARGLEPVQLAAEARGRGEDEAGVALGPAGGRPRAEDHPGDTVKCGAYLHSTLSRVTTAR